LCVDTVANHIVTISPRKIENFFNRCIQCLAKQGIFPKGIKAACDCTLYETTEKFKDCGTVTLKRKVKARGRRKSGELKAMKDLSAGSAQAGKGSILPLLSQTKSMAWGS